VVTLEQPGESLLKKHQLIGAEVSLYTGKVRAYLRFKKIAFDEITATREVFRDVIVPRTGVRFIPVLISADDVAVQDSTAIIDHLELRYPSASIYPAGPVQRLVSLLFEVYADEWLVIPAMHYRWNDPENRAYAIEEFGRLSVPNATPEEHRAIGEKLAVPFAGALPALGVGTETAPAIEASYLSFLRDFDRHLTFFPYLLGGRPSIGDFGLYGPLYAHLARDPASGRLMRAHAPKVADWVERMTMPPAPLSGDFLFDDEVPSTLDPLLARMFTEQGPVLSRTIAAIAAYAATSPDGLVPRGLGRHSFLIEGARGERAIYPFNVYRFQRAHDQYAQLDDAARARADALLAKVGGLDLLQAPIPQRLTRENNRLAIAH
jgi:glutathione S-transferase